MNLYNLPEIETELRATADAACEDGIKALLKSKNISIKEFITNKEKYNKDFLQLCHDGFKIAQDRIAKNVLLIQEEQVVVLEQLKKARQEKNKAKVVELIKKDKHLEHIATLFKHCADALVWQLIQGQLWILRRLYLNVGGQKKLKEVNLTSVKKVADQINSNPMNFVLITDLTNNVQVGDLIGIINGQFALAEVKEGKKNYEVLEVIKELGNNQKTPEKVIEKFKKEPKFIDHLQRTLKQLMTLQNVHEILSTDTGTDPISKKKITIQTPKERTAVYNERLSALQEQLASRNFWAYDVIEGCLHIGIYKGEKRFDGHLVLKAIAEEAKRPNYIMIDMLSVFKSLNQPIFFLPFSVDFIFDIIFSRTKIFLMLDLDGYIELYKNYGFVAEWASRKETSKVSEIVHGHDIFKLNNRGIRIKVDGGESEMWLSHGTLTRIFFEQIYPSYMAYSANYHLK